MMIGWLIETRLPFAEAPDCGALGADLEAYVRAAAKILSDPTISRIVAHLYAELTTDSSLADLIRRTVEPLKRQPLVGLIDRAIARGELTPGIDQRRAADFVQGPLCWRMIVMRHPLQPKRPRALGKGLASLAAAELMIPLANGAVLAAQRNDQEASPN
jgi:hypothetical protein